MNITDDANIFTPTEVVLPSGEDPRDPNVSENLLNIGYLLLHEGKTFWHFDDHWEDRPQNIINIKNISKKNFWKYRSLFYRIVFRKVASSTNERTFIITMIPPKTLTVDSVYTKHNPGYRFDSSALILLAFSSSFSTDWCVRQLVSANVNLFIINRVPLPKHNLNSKLFIHNALRLLTNHAGYLRLWKSQIGNAWREFKKPKYNWPVLATDEERWKVRSAIDAAVAEAYGLNRNQYKHILSTFSHASYPKAPELCLARFDELKSMGIEEFTKKYDPYWDIPLNENLPQPDPAVSAAIEKFSGEAVRSRVGSSNKNKKGIQRELYE